jgi:O-antigen/teichoic acid export membrane protein
VQGGDEGAGSNPPRPAPEFSAGGLGTATGILVVGKVASNVLLVLLGVATARGLGPTGRGTLTLAVTVATATTYLCSAGAGSALRVLLAKSFDSALFDAFFGLAAVMMLAQVCVTAAAVALFLPVTGVHMTPSILLWTTCVGVLSLASYLLLDVVLATGQVRRLAVADVAGSGLQLMAYVAIATTSSPTVTGALAAITAGYALQVFILMGSLPRRSGGRPFDRVAWRQILRTGRAPLTQNLAQFTTFKIDRILLGAFRSPTQVGLYSVAATAAEVLRLIPLGAGQVLLHRVASGQSDGRDLRRVRRWVFGIVVTGAISSAVVAPVLLRFIFGPGFRDAGELVALLAAAEIALTGYQLDSHLLQASGRFRKAALPAIMGVPLVIVLDLLLIPPFGGVGAAIASIATYGVLSTLSRWFLRQLSIDV